MSSIDSAVFKAAISLIMNSGDLSVDETIKDHVYDKKYHGLILREIDDIKSMLKGRASEDLLASIDFINEGIESLYNVFDKVESRCKPNEKRVQATFETAGANAEPCSFRTAMLELTDLDELATKELSTAKEKFKDALFKATTVFANEAFEISDRLLASKHRVMATVLETIDNPLKALEACKMCLKEIHSLPAVKRSFKVELSKGPLTWFSKDERRKAISTVCHINRVIYDITRAVGKDTHVWFWPYVDTEEDKVDPLRDSRVTEVLRKQGEERFCVTPSSFGQEGEEENSLKATIRIATNTNGQFIVGPNGKHDVKVFEGSGKFLYALPSPADVAQDGKLFDRDVATDRSDDTYVLISQKKSGSEKFSVHVFRNATDLHRKIPLIEGTWHFSRLTVTGNKKLMVLAIRDRKHVVDVYDSDGQFLRSFGGGILKNPSDITATNDGCVMVVTDDDSHVHVFNELGEHLYKFKVQPRSCSDLRIAFNQVGEYVVVAGNEKQKHRLHIVIYTKEGRLDRSIVINNEEKDAWLVGVTVTMEGLIAIALQTVDRKGKVLVL